MDNSTPDKLELLQVRNGEELHALGQFTVPSNPYNFGTIRGRSEGRLEADQAKDVTIQSLHQRFEGKDDEVVVR